MVVIPFYATSRPDLFALERAAMDRPGHVIQALDRGLPHGLTLDVGAGDGFTATALHRPGRTIVPLEPAAEMIDKTRPLRWLRGEAESLPFAADTFDAAYATWAYFFSRDWDPSPGVEELHRVVRPGGVLLIVDNLGSDEFCSLTDHDIAADPALWESQGFACEEVSTSFEFATQTDAETLLGFYFGEVGRARAHPTVGFRVGVFHGISR